MFYLLMLEIRFGLFAVFNISTNDISQLRIKKSFFADDAVFYAESGNIHELVEIIRIVSNKILRILVWLGEVKPKMIPI